MSGRERTSPAWRQLGALVAGDQVPAACYVLDYADGTRPRWTVHELEQLGSGVRRLVLVDPDNGADDLFDHGARVGVTVLTWRAKTLRSQPHPLGQPPAPILCDLDQQGRHVAGRSAEIAGGAR